MGGKPAPEWKIKTIKKLWDEGDLSATKIAQRVGMTTAGVFAVAKRLGLPSKGHWKGDKL
tara:strand:+ start:152 stop:331 length:180 start_codon:yes stop_codon:yes gene_type:complete